MHASAPAKCKYARMARSLTPRRPPQVIIGVIVGGALLLLIVFVILILYRRKSSESSRVLKNMQEQMDVLELRVAAECKEGGCDVQDGRFGTKRNVRMRLYEYVC